MASNRGLAHEKRRKKLAEVRENIKNNVAEKAAKVKAKTADKNTTRVNEGRLELLVTIVNRSKAEYYLDLLQSFEINMQTVLLGRGTADAKMLELFGFSDSEKAVIFGVIRDKKIPEALAALDEKFKTIKNGKGIAYTLPLSSMIGTLLFGFLSNNRAAVRKGEDNGK